MLTENQISQAIIERLIAYLPSAMQDSVLPYLDKPAQLTSQILSTRHPIGLYLVQFMESDNNNGSEDLIFGVCCLTSGLEQNHKLTRAAKYIVTGWQIPGATRFDLHGDKPMDFKEDNGIIGRIALFRLTLPSVKITEAAIPAAIDALRLEDI